MAMVAVKPAKAATLAVVLDQNLQKQPQKKKKMRLVEGTRAAEARNEAPAMLVILIRTPAWGGRYSAPGADKTRESPPNQGKSSLCPWASAFGFPWANLVFKMIYNYCGFNWLLNSSYSPFQYLFILFIQITSAQKVFHWNYHSNLLKSSCHF